MTDFYVVLTWRLNEKAISGVEVDSYVFFNTNEALQAIDHWKAQGWNARLDTHMLHLVETMKKG